MSMDVKLSNFQVAKIMKSDEFLGKTLGNMLSNLGKKPLLDLGVPLGKIFLSKLITKATFCMY